MNHIKISKKRILINSKDLLVLLLIFISANASFFSQDDMFLAAISAILLAVFILKKKKFNLFIFIIIIVWILINSVSFIINQTVFNSYTLIGFIIKLLIPYLILKLVGESIIFRLEKFIYYLALISLPIFLLQILFPELFFKFSHYLNFMTNSEQIKVGGWYLGVYMFSGWHVFRNSGFMWEPGAFAFMIILAILININKSGVKFNFKNIIYMITLISTFSTMGYLAMSLIIFLYIIKTRKYYLVLILVPIIVYYVIDLLKLDFLLPKLIQRIETINNQYLRTGYSKFNRLGYFVFALKNSLSWPFGYGIVESKGLINIYRESLEGVGTISKILIYWGWLGVLFFVYAMRRYFLFLQPTKDNIILLFSIVILAIAFFSNPMEKNPILFLIIYISFIFNKNIKKTI